VGYVSQISDLVYNIHCIFHSKLLADRLPVTYCNSQLKLNTVYGVFANTSNSKHHWYYTVSRKKKPVVFSE